MSDLNPRLWIVGFRIRSLTLEKLEFGIRDLRLEITSREISRRFVHDYLTIVF
jgi:hypothetical protein